MPNAAYVGCTIAHVDAPSKLKFADLAFLQLPEPLDGVRSVGEQIQSCPVVLDDPDGPVVDAVVYPGLGTSSFWATCQRVSKPGTRCAREAPFTLAPRIRPCL